MTGRLDDIVFVFRPSLQPWRVCVTRDEPAAGPLTSALRAQAFVVTACPVLIATPPRDPAPLAAAARRLEHYDWVVCASARAVGALVSARGAAWPGGVRTAAVGAATAQALHDAGATPRPITARAGGAEPLWTALAPADTWPGRQVLVPTTPGGRRLLGERLRASGAEVDEVEAYRMAPRDPGAIARDWTAAAPDAVVIASGRVAQVLCAAVGAEALTALHAVVAIGTSTADTLAELGVRAVVAAATDFASTVAALAAAREAEVRT